MTASCGSDASRGSAWRSSHTMETLTDGFQRLQDGSSDNSSRQKQRKMQPPNSSASVPQTTTSWENLERHARLALMMEEIRASEPDLPPLSRGGFVLVLVLVALSATIMMAGLVAIYDKMTTLF